ncbi:MAG: LexA family protein [Ktedonobacteraceae bacterium]
MSFPSPADDYLEPRLQLDNLIVHPAATFFVRMAGIAMEPTIHTGDVLIVDRAIVPLDRRAVVVIFQEKFFVRRILIEDEKITLKAGLSAFVDIVATVDEIEVWGVVTYAITKLNAPAWKRRRRKP